MARFKIVKASTILAGGCWSALRFTGNCGDCPKSDQCREKEALADSAIRFGKTLTGIRAGEKKVARLVARLDNALTSR